jgi:hypothetical protein
MPKGRWSRSSGGPSRPKGRWARWLRLAGRPRLGKWLGRLSWTGPKLGEERKSNFEIDFQKTIILEIQIKEILESEGIWGIPKILKIWSSGNWTWVNFRAQGIGKEFLGFKDLENWFKESLRSKRVGIFS